jgi:mono/diheme cytochrome c family protein
MDRVHPHSALRLALALAAVAGCASTTAPATTTVAAPVTATPDAGAPMASDASTAPSAPVRAAREPTALDREVAVGIGVFMRVCGTCHEAMWRVPTGGHLPRLRWTEAAMRRQIRAGSGRSSASAMPAIDAGRLPESEMPALFAYLRSIEAVVSP